MKKTYFKLSLLMVFLSFLWSCQHELLQTGQDYSVQSQNITVQRLSREELQLQHPDVIQKVENLISKKHSAKGIYTDAENGFSIDTDVAVYIQDRYGNKTYTFEAITDKKDASVLQNIVLKDLGDGTFSVWMANYDQELLSNREQTSTEFLKQHITLNNLGDKKGSDIFGKYLMCFTPIAMYEFIPAIPCTSNEHHTDPSQCDCGTPGHNCTPPTPSNYEFLYYMGTFDCGPGGSGNTTGGDGNNTGGTTLPVGSGGSGNASINDPCAKLKAMLNKNIPSNTPPGPISEMPAFLQNHLNALTTGARERAINVYYPPGSTNLTTAIIDSSPQDGSLQATVSIPAGSKSVFFGHDHTYDQKVLSIFSLADLNSILIMQNNGGADSNTYFYLTTKFGTKYYLRFANNDFKDWMNQNNFFMGWDDSSLPSTTMNPLKVASENKYEKYVKYDKTPEENLKGFYEFFDKKDILGIDMLEVLPNGDTYKLMYSNGTVLKTKCQ